MQGYLEPGTKYGCYNRAPFKEMVDHKKIKNAFPFRMSMNCQYDISGKDERCSGCKHAKK